MRFPRHFARCADPFGEPPIRNTVTRRGVGRIVRARARVRAPALRGRRWLGTGGPKFPHEALPEALAAAVRRHGVRHPVLDDADLVTWDAYAVRAWPTLVLVDPGGYVVAQVSGEGHSPELSAVVDELVAEHGDVLRRGPLFGHALAEVPQPPSDLLFPGKATVLAGGDVLVSDSGLVPGR